MNDETQVHTTPHRCPECDGPIRLEFTRSEDGGDVTSETYECRDCRKSFMLLDFRIAETHRGLEEWVPDGSEVSGPTYGPDGHDFIRWRVDFPDGVVARVSFLTEQLVNARDTLWDTIRVHSLLQGGSGNYRVEPGGVVLPNPPEWKGW